MNLALHIYSFLLIICAVQPPYYGFTLEPELYPSE